MKAKSDVHSKRAIINHQSRVEKERVKVKQIKNKKEIKEVKQTNKQTNPEEEEDETLIN